MITIIRGITLIDGTGADPLHNVALAFSQEGILEVGRASQVSVPREVHVIKADALLLLPGLIYTPRSLVYSGLNLLEEISFGLNRTHRANCSAAQCDHLIGNEEVYCSIVRWFAAEIFRV
jgi:hypothetical protein